MRISDWSSDVCSSDLPPLLAVEHQPRLPQDGEMLRHRGLRHAGLGGQHPDRLPALLAQSLEQRAARRIGQSLEEHVPRFNHNPLTLRLWFFHNHIALYRSRGCWLWPQHPLAPHLAPFPHRQTPPPTAQTEPAAEIRPAPPPSAPPARTVARTALGASDRPGP